MIMLILLECSSAFLCKLSVKVLLFSLFFLQKKDSYFPFLVPSVHTEWNKQEVNELVSGRAWLDRWHDIYLVACFPSAWLSPRGQFETFNLVSKPSPEPGGWTIHDGFRRTADTVYFRLHATISVDARAWKNHAQRYLCGPSDPWSSPRPGAGNSVMLIYISCARYSRFDWAGWRLMKDPCAVFLDAYLWFPTLVYTCDSSSLCYIYPPKQHCF